MRLFKDSRGFIISFGFDMIGRRPDPFIISWWDPSTNQWDATSANLAGFNRLTFEINPEFIFEYDGRIVAYQPGLCLEMKHVGLPMIWSFKIMRPTPVSSVSEKAA